MADQLKLRLQLAVQEAGVINGFCYPYARLLYEKALQLRNDRHLFKIDAKAHDPHMAEDLDLTEMAYQVLLELSSQVGGKRVESRGNGNDVLDLLAHAQRFLAIFEPAQS